MQRCKTGTCTKYILCAAGTVEAEVSHCVGKKRQKLWELCKGVYGGSAISDFIYLPESTHNRLLALMLWNVVPRHWVNLSYYVLRTTIHIRGKKGWGQLPVPP